MMKRFCSVLLLSILLLPALSAQSYRIYFTDKGGQDIASINPLKLLSAEALQRRAERNIALDKYDLPVASEYVNALARMDLEIEMQSRWLNYIKVRGVTNLNSIEQLPFVQRIEVVKPSQVKFTAKTALASDSVIYGFSGNQIEMVNGHFLHNQGSLGQGMRIAVLDGGFQGAKNLPGLDSLWADGRVKDANSYIATDTSVFQGGSHGTTVLSVLAGFIDSVYVGSAWKADYYLYRTEFEPTETTTEMDNWVMAAERADSMGVDIITSSLGYTTFDNGVGDYSFVDLDGNTTVVTRAADLAASRGILVIVSAGNLGDATWQYISAPADGDSVLAVGAAWPDGSYATFSSWGPTADGRIKPDVSAQGVATAILTPAGVSFGNGTSFSCPVISGLAACLWQNNPSMTNMDIIEAIRTNASQYFDPDNRLGFGLANFRDAQWSISQKEFEPDENRTGIITFPNPSSGKVSLDISALKNVQSINIFDLSGELIQEVPLSTSDLIEFQMPIKAGIYLLAIQCTDQVYLERLVRK